MQTLNQRIRQLEILIAHLQSQVAELSHNADDTKINPHSIVGKDLRFENLDLVFDAETGFWKTYAVYKNDEED